MEKSNEIEEPVGEFILQKKNFPTTRSEYQKELEQWIIEYLREKFHFITLKDTNEILFYEDGRYKTGGENIIEIETEKLHKQVSIRQVQEIKAHIRRRKKVDRRDLDKDPSILNLKNCLLDTKTFQKLGHSPEHLSVVQFPFKYNPEAKCPNILKFLKTTIDRADVKKVLALTGCALTGNNSFQLCGLSIGNGFNGKSVLNGVNEALFGENNVSHVALQELDKDLYAPADLYRKRFNICGDLPIRPLTDTGIIKKVVSGDRIRAQRKFGQPFDFEPKLVMWFSTNKLPETPDNTVGFYRRFVYIHFPHNFEGREDAQLLSKLTTEDELSGYLNLLIQSMKWIRRTGKFPGLESIEKREETYNKIQNPAEYFLEELVEEKIGESITKDEMHQIFSSWCKTNNLPVESKESFGKKLSQLGYITLRKTINGNRTYVWKDLSIVKTQPKED